MIRPFLLLFLGCALAMAGDPTPPPVVIRSEPVSGAEAVDPALTELRVTFNRDMTLGNYSFTSTQFGPVPGSGGEPRFLPDGRTCVMPVKLKPSTAYVVGINWGRFNNFMDKDQNRALPWLLVFRTADRSPAAGRNGNAQDTAKAEALALQCAKDLQAGRHDAILARFDATMRSLVDAPQLAGGWALTEQQCGTPITHGTPTSERLGAVQVVTVPLRGPKGTFHLVCSCDAGNRLVGLWLRPAASGQRLGLWRWQDHPLPTGATLDQDRLRVTATGATTVPLGVWDKPGVTEARFALSARIRCQKVPQAGHLELWTRLADGTRFFSRTMATEGPMGHLSGDQEWRDIFLPADASGNATRPERLEVNLILPAGGTVEIGPLQLAQFPGAQTWAPVLPETTTAP